VRAYCTCCRDSSLYARVLLLLLPCSLIASSVGVNYYNSGSGVYTSGTTRQACYNPDYSPHLCMALGELPYDPQAYRPAAEAERTNAPQLGVSLSSPLRVQLKPIHLDGVVTAVDENSPARLQEMKTRTYDAPWCVCWVVWVYGGAILYVRRCVRTWRELLRCECLVV
jgi:hypothetical protein